MWGLQEEKLRWLTQSLSNYVSYTEKKKDLCSIRHEIHVCSLKWLSHVNVMKIMLSIYSIFRELISQSYSQQHSVSKNSSTQLSNYAASQPPSRAATHLQRDLGIPEGLTLKQIKDLFHLLSKFLWATNPLLCTLLHDAKPWFSHLHCSLGSRLLLGSAVRALEETGQLQGRTDVLLLSLLLVPLKLLQQWPFTLAGAVNFIHRHFPPHISETVPLCL